MLHLTDNTLVLAATDLTNHLACSHLTQQQLAVARSERSAPQPVADPHADLIRARGEAHEIEQLERLSAECGGHVDLSQAGSPYSQEGLEGAVAATAEAMKEGAPLIYQAQLLDGEWQGRADFLRRIDGESALGEHAYEVLDTKLSRQVKPHFVHQLSLYNRLLASAQGFEPEVASLILGDGSTTPIELRRYAALHRHVARRVEEVAAAPASVTYPEPVSHCAICDLAAECRARLVADDHLSLVAGMRRDNRDQLDTMGISTVLGLAEAGEPAEGDPLGAGRFSTLQGQAALQVKSRNSGSPAHRHLAPRHAAGYALLPDPSPGDVFFDLEGDPYIGDDGLEYLWGWWTAEAGYECVWAHDAVAEKAALEQFVDRVGELREEHPGMHVFHYAPHERSKLRSLSIRHATREDEVDRLLRAEVLVDLYAVVRQGMQVGEESYSLKRLERHHGFERLEERVREGGGSIVVYEAWLGTGEAEFLAAIRAYNEEDCRSTLSLRDWLAGDMRSEAGEEFGVDFAEYREPESEEREPPEWIPGVHALIDRLTADLAAPEGEGSPDEEERRLLADLLLYHYRESKPSWWRYFDLRGKPVADLIDDRDALAGLERDERVAPTTYKQSLDYTFTFPAQEFRLDKGSAEDPITGESCSVVSFDEDRVVLRRGKNAPPPAPTALTAGSPIPVRVLREALVELAESVLAGEDRFAAARALLRREPPRLSSGQLDEDTDSLISAALGLDRSVLPVQGPPGTGKTFRGARMVAAALAEGRRVGITARSHAAIQNLLDKFERHASEAGLAVAAIYKGSNYESPHGLVEATESNRDVTADHQLVAGTQWLFTRPEHRQSFDLIFVDEAGQFSLADAAAVGLAAESLVLLGDPQQLPQVTQAEHPGGSGSSVLEHVLAGRRTIDSESGVLLTESWRMHPDVCDFVSERSYDGRLRSRSACRERRVDAPIGEISGVGLRAIAIEHEGRSQASPEEAAAIAAACERLLEGATVTDDRGTTRDLAPTDILVVAPYNLAVRRLRERLPEGVRVGTVDRFQGQQAPVVFYAMTCSTGEDVPRGMEFLFDAHRLNVAVSRAECLAVLVHSPRLLDADCKTTEAMELVDGVCRFVELATPVAPG